MGWFIKGLPKEEPKAPIHSGLLAKVVPVRGGNPFWVDEGDYKSIMASMMSREVNVVAVTPYELRLWQREEDRYGMNIHYAFCPQVDMHLQVTNILSITELSKRNIFDSATFQEIRFY